jgi:hypothetical protein
LEAHRSNCRSYLAHGAPAGKDRCTDVIATADPLIAARPQYAMSFSGRGSAYENRREAAADRADRKAGTARDGSNAGAGPERRARASVRRSARQRADAATAAGAA